MAGIIQLHDSLELQPRGSLVEDVVGYETEQYRSQTEAPIRKLTVDLIKTYRKINDVRTIHTYMCVVPTVVGGWEVCGCGRFVVFYDEIRSEQTHVSMYCILHVHVYPVSHMY